MTPEQLEHLHACVYRQTGQDPLWVGYWIKRFVESEELTLVQVAQTLGISGDNLVLLCLCRTPRSDCFQEDLRVLCERTGAKEEEIARIIRQEQAMIRWRDHQTPDSAGWLMAASDGEDPDEDKAGDKHHDD